MRKGNDHQLKKLSLNSPCQRFGKCIENSREKIVGILMLECEGLIPLVLLEITVFAEGEDNLFLNTM